jgi:hypothetical protein
MPAEWWTASGMEGFECRSASYRFAPLPNVCLVALADIKPMNMDDRQHLGHGGFCPERMMRVLQGIASNNEMPAIEIVERRHGPYQYVVGGASGRGGGVHRFYASVAAGFSHIPAVLSWLPDHVLNKL